MSYSPSKSRMSDGLSNRREGKIVMEWEFRSSRSDKVTLIRVRAKRDYVSGATSQMVFVADSKLLKEKISDTDINRLYERVREALDRQDDIDRGIAWENWLEIRVRGDNTEPLQTSTEFESQWHSPKAELEIGYCHLRRGVTGDGRVVTINSNGIIVDFPKPKHLGALGAMDNDRIRFDDRCGVCYVPATPENLAAVKRLLDDMQRLRERVAELMSQEHIVNTLQLAASAPVLLIAKEK